MKINIRDMSMLLLTASVLAMAACASTQDDPTSPPADAVAPTTDTATEVPADATTPPPADSTTP